MMRRLRESTKVIMVVVAIAFVGLMVFEWGMDLSGRTGSPTGSASLGSVNGEEITLEEYQGQYQGLLEQAQQEAPQGLSSEDLDRIEDRAWQSVINLMLLRQEARRRGIGLTDRELLEFIRWNPPPELVGLPAFQTEGRFDIQKYQEALADPALASTWARYEESLRRSLPIRKLQEQVVAGVVVTEAELLEEYRERNERARIAYLYLDPERLVPESEVPVTQEEIAAWYEEHREEFRRAPSASIRYVVVAAEPTAADSARARALADSLARLAAEPDADFADLAADHSDDPMSAPGGGDLGWIRPDAMAPDVAALLNRLEPGEVGGPVASPFGWHVIKLENRQEADGETRVQARQILVAVEPTASARAEARDAARELAREAGAGGPEAFDEAATERGLEVHAPPVFEEGVVIPGIGPAPGLARFAFENPAGSVSGPLERNDGFYVVRVEQRYPAGYVALESVAPRIRAEIVRRKRLEATRELAQRIAETVRQEGLEGAAERYGLEVRVTDWFRRTNNVPGIGSGTPVAGAAFGLAEGQTAGPIETSRGLYFLRLLEKQPYDPEAFEQARESLRDELLMAKMRNTFEAWFEARREAARIEDNRAELLGT